MLLPRPRKIDKDYPIMKKLDNMVTEPYAEPDDVDVRLRYKV